MGLSLGFKCGEMLNSQKVLKSTCIFFFFFSSIHRFSVDVTKFGLTDVRDAMDDANFVFETTKLYHFAIGKGV
jgi:hypothetical protein